MSQLFPQLPKTDRRTITLSIETERRLLSRRVVADATDMFATDTDASVRRLGRLALRRDVRDPSDFFALGDLCAELSHHNGRLLVMYVGKTLSAYQEAEKVARQDAEALGLPEEPNDVLLARSAIERYVQWLLDIAKIAPTPRNIAVALWAVTEIPQTEEVREKAVTLAKLYITATVGGAPTDQVGRQTVVMPQLPTPAESSESSLVIELPNFTPGQQIFISGTGAEPGETQSSEVVVGGMGDPDDDEPKTEDHAFTAESLNQRESLESMTASAVSPPTPASKAPHVFVRMEEEVSAGDFRRGELIRDSDSNKERYEVSQVLRGGMGIIYLCYDHETHGAVALKTFQSRFLDNKRIEARFTQEAHTWIRLEKHNHIVQALKVASFGSERVRKRPHIILECIKGPEGLGPDLKSWIEHNRMDTATSVEMGLHICLGMEHAVRKVPGLVHRDLKPANILVRHDGLAKVTDFGLVRARDTLSDTQEFGAVMNAAFDDGEHSHRLTRIGTIVGTAPYMSPEQCMGEPVDLRSDIYAFGAILFEMLTRNRLFKARTSPEWIEAHLNAIPEFPHGLSIPSPLRALTLRCLAKRRDNRFESWEALRNELAHIYEEITGIPPVFDVSGAELEVRDLMDKAYSLTEIGFGQEALSTYDRALELSPDNAWIWARKGRTLRELKHYDEALVSYDNALQLNPQFAWAWSGKGIILERMNEFEAARAAYETAIRWRGNDLWATYYLGNLLLNGGFTEEALSAFERTLQIDPNHLQSHVQRGKTLAALGRLEEALRAYERAIALDTAHYYAWMGKGQMLRELRRNEEAAIAFRQAIRLLPKERKEIAPFLRLADALISQDKYAEALPEIKQASINRPEYKGVWIRLGLILRHLGRYGEALEAYDKALALEPEYAPALNGKGEVLEKQGDFEGALHCYQAALRVAPGHTIYLYRVADALSALYRHEEAARTLDELVQLDENSKFAWARLGRVRHRLGKLDEAVDAFARALALDSDYAFALNGCGMVYTAQGRHLDALVCFEKATHTDGRRAWYWYNRADTLITLRRYTEALTVLDRALVLDEQQASSWAMRGQALRRLGRFEDAIMAYDRALAIDPGYAYALNGRGVALERLGRREEAIACFEKAVEHAPNVLWYRLNLIDPLLKMGRRDDALDVCDDAIRLMPPGAAIGAIPWTHKGQVLRYKNCHEEAIEAYDQAIALNPRYARSWDGKGRVCADLGMREVALQCFTEAVALVPSNVWFRYNQGEALIELGRYEEAVNVLNRALELDPGHERSRLKRDEARKKLFKIE